MKVDLHLHSHFSDGSDSLEDVFIQAKEAGLTHISVVDHDTTKHHEQGKLLAAQYEIEFIPGIEISAYDFCRNRKVHLLGYQLPEHCPNIKAICDPLLKRRHTHSLWQIERVQSVGFQLNEEEIHKYAEMSGTIYKQHIMHSIIDEHYDSKNYQTLYKSLFKKTGVASGDIVYIDVFDALKAIKEDGGIAVVAHPGQLDSFDVAEDLVEYGLDGIELVHPDHSTTDMERVRSLAAKYNLIVTGGSDYHGRYGKQVQLGQYIVTANPFVDVVKQL